MKRLPFFLFGLLLFIQFLASAQKNPGISLTGIITDTKTGQPLPGASVVISDAKVGTAADAAGRYHLKNIPAGHHLIEISSTGYTNAVVHVDMNTDKELNFSLQPSVAENIGVVITGVANATSIRKAPIPVTTVNRTDLLKTPATNIVDALTRQPGVSQVSTGPAISKPVIRGLGYNRVVVINDGVRQEGQQWGDEHGLEIDEASVVRAEVLKGPASLMYGSDALAGVINLLTNMPIAVGTVKANVLTSYQTNSGLASLHANIAGNQNGFNWNAYGTLRGAGDYKNRYDGRVLNSRFNESNFGGYMGINKKWGYSHLIFSRFYQNAGIVEGERDSATGKFVLYGGSPLEHIASLQELKDREPTIPYQNIQHYKLALENNINLGKSLLKINGGYQDNKRREYGDVQQRNEAATFFDLKTITYQAHWQMPEMNHWRNTIGINGMYQLNRNRAEEVIIPDYNLNDIGGFVFTQALYQKISISGGLRFDHRSLRSHPLQQDTVIKFIAFDKNFSNFSGSAGISYEPSDAVTLKANIAQGFRAPNMAELGSNGAHEGTNRYEIGEKDLKSEKSFQVDAGAVYNAEHFTVNISAFTNNVNNFIYYRKLESMLGDDSIVLAEGKELMVFRFDQNNAFLRGFEASFDLHPHPLDWLHIENRFSVVRGQFRQSVDNTRNLPLIPAARLVSEVRGDFKNVSSSIKNMYARLELDNTFAQNHPFTAYNTETRTPGYSLLNTGLGADIVKKGTTLFSVHFAVNNITDQSYQSHLNRLKYTDVNNVTGRQGVYNMGRNFSLKLNVPFSWTTK
ncbi:MAG: TonB-dependent receptor [Flavisolibacter sp.]|nr:TonB-dependent receptor [Flavisolibacter sp.]